MTQIRKLSFSVRNWVKTDPFAGECIAMLVIGAAAAPFVLQRFQTM